LTEDLPIIRLKFRVYHQEAGNGSSLRDGGVRMTLSEISFASVQNAMASAYARGNSQSSAPVRVIAEPVAPQPIAAVAEIAAYPSHKGSLISIRA